jgi:hypothetical protein
MGCLNAVITAMPQRVESDAMHPLDTWTMVVAENDQDLVLTLHAPDGRTVSFATKPYQVQDGHDCDLWDRRPARDEAPALN